MFVNRCLNCMEDIENNTVCPYCGYDTGKYHFNPDVLKPNTILQGKYLVGNMLGRGGFGITYIGYDLALNLKVAIKEYYPPSLASRNSAVSNDLLWQTQAIESGAWRRGCDSFLSEARKMAKIQSIPEIVGVRDVFEENHTAYIVMEYIPGITVANYIKKNGVFSYNEIVPILQPLIYGLDKVHRQGIIHRDISPTNLMLTPEGKFYLLDLGAAKDLKDHKNQTGSFTTIGYSAIEQYSRNGNIGPGADVYSLAASIYYCLFGKNPPSAVERLENDTLSFSGKTKTKLTAKQIEVLKKGLAVKQELRYQTAQEFAVALQNAMKKGVSFKKVAGICAVVAAAVLVFSIAARKPWLPTVELKGCTDANRMYSSYVVGENYEYFSDLDANLRIITYDEDRHTFPIDESQIIYDQDPDIPHDGCNGLNLSDDAFYAVYHGGSGNEDHLLRMDLDGTNQEILYTMPRDNFDTQYVRLSNGDEFMYYLLDDGSVEGELHPKLMRYHIGMDKTDQVKDEDIRWYSVNGKYMYYSIWDSALEKYCLYRSELSGKGEKLLDDHRSFENGFWENGKLYLYQAYNANGDYNPGFVCVDEAGKVLDEGRGVFDIDINSVMWTAGNDWLFYVEEEGSKLCRVRLDGTGKSVICEGHEYGGLTYDDNYLYFIDGVVHEEAFIPSQSYLVPENGGTVLSFGISPSEYITNEDGLQFVIINDEARVTGYVGKEENVVVPNHFYGYPLNENMLDGQFYTQYIPIEQLTLYKTIHESELKYTKLSDQITITGYSGQITGGYTDVAIPSEIEGLPVTVIKEGVFAGQNFTSIYLPKNLREIGEEAFLGCSNLKRVIFPETLRDIGRSVFSECSFENVELALPEGLESMGMDAFCTTYPTRIILPSTLTGLEPGALNGCHGEYIVSKDNPSFLSDDGFVFTKKRIMLVAAPSDVGGEYVVPKGVTIIAPFAFYGTDFESIILPYNLLEIYSGAFMKCKNLKNVFIPKSVKFIGEKAFWQTRLTNVTISPDCELDDSAFPSNTTVKYYDDDPIPLD